MLTPEEIQAVAGWPADRRALYEQGRAAGRIAPGFALTFKLPPEDAGQRADAPADEVAQPEAPRARARLRSSALQKLADHVRALQARLERAEARIARLEAEARHDGR